jgi:NYN domain
MTAKIAAGVTKLALLIDGDNVSATFMPLIWREAEKHGAVAVRRIYGQFKSGKMKSWQKHIADFDLMPVNVSPLTRGKNATDMKLVIEAMDMLYGRQLDGFCIASSDGDFTPLAARVRGNAIAVYGFGAKKAPAGYKAEFDRFYECDTMLAAEKKMAPKRVSAPVQKAAASPATLKSKPRLPAAPKAAPMPRAAVRVVAKSQQPPQAAPKANQPGAGAASVPLSELLAAMDRAKGPDGWTHVRDLGHELARTGFSPTKNHYRVAALVKLHPDVIEIAKRGNDPFVRRRPS